MRATRMGSSVQDTPATAGLGFQRCDLHVVVVMAPTLFREALAMALWDQGLLVTTFATLAAAEDVWVGQPVHAVVVDATAAPLAGLEAARRLRVHGKGAARVVAVGPQGVAAASGPESTWVVEKVSAQSAEEVARGVCLMLGVEPGPWRAQLRA